MGVRLSGRAPLFLSSRLCTNLNPFAEAMSEIRRIAVNTGGGDAPGLNAVIRSVVLAAERRGWEVCGILDSYDGLFTEDGVIPLDRRSVRGITHIGGTILGTTNRGNPAKWPVKGADGSVTYEDRTQRVVDEIAKHDIDALIAIGGDGSLVIAQQLAEKGLKVVGVPKTIDNDLAATSVTFGFMTAVETATDAIGKLHSTAEAHERVMVVELMGRTAGWISLYAGVAGTADVILIPEIPYDIESVCSKIEKRYAGGSEFAIVVVSEGAFPAGGQPLFKQTAEGQKRLGGMSKIVSNEIHERTGRETRELVLGHLQRGGGPNAYDRLLALRFGAAAVKFVGEGKFGTMVALDPPDVLAVPLADAVAEIKTVPLHGDVVETARALGICLGD
jgi:phosphofructokinase-like protein